QTPMQKSEFVWMALDMQSGKVKKVKPTRRVAGLPVGPTARIAFEIDAMRAGCSKAAQTLLRQEPVNEVELEECARLDDALAGAHKLLKAAVRSIMVSRLRRSSRARGR